VRLEADSKLASGAVKYGRENASGDHGLAAPADAQPAGRTYRIGYVFLGAEPPDPQKMTPWPTLRELGYIEGTNRSKANANRYST
jgi:hypothetical protein